MSENRPPRRGVESLPITFTAVHPQSSQGQTVYDELLEDDRLYPTRPPSSARRYRTTDHAQPTAVVPRGEQSLRRLNQYDTVNVYVRRRSLPAAQQQPATPSPRPIRRREPEPQEHETETEPLHRSRKRFGVHWAVYLGIGMLAMVLLWILGVSLLNWWYGYQDDLRYGRPRTFQCDARVGHNDTVMPSHFIALNLNRHVEVIEFPGGDATHARVYLGPTLIGQDSEQDIVTLSFRDVTGDSKPDMILSVGTAKYVYLNDNGAFRPVKPGDHVNG